ncbi:hypothetical protein BDV96DRAFT_489873 [Lophiotrema nucula]|uniref:Essential protein Yae1 N-terminal domain-containing protein n=1 Tax=Lophiotrema nucula TaxID=690887 RepID=A0A6A5ZEE0_9PLEO|nr:hypothetical protein BDV96DRAFT_489873 [Lophiotrema nucula]
MPQQSTAPDPFDTLLTLEDTLYTTAYTHGTRDGAHAGRIEGRVFGLEKGFEKYSSMGVLHGRALVWNARVSSPTSPSNSSGFQELESERRSLPTLKPNGRLEKNIHILTHLTDPLTFSTENSEEAVADFDDRLKRAGAKAKIIEKTIGKTTSTALSPERKGDRKGMKLAGEGKKDENIEDFTGSRFLS